MAILTPKEVGFADAVGVSHYSSVKPMIVLSVEASPGEALGAAIDAARNEARNQWEFSLYLRLGDMLALRHAADAPPLEPWVYRLYNHLHAKYAR